VNEYDASGRLVKGVLNERGELEDLAKDCTSCHEPDVERGLMLPIHYESHCARCHPLLYGQAGKPSVTVPHERPDVVLGFLTRQATSDVLRESGSPASQGTNLRNLPGVPYQPPLSTAQTEDVEARVREAQRIAMEHTHTLFGEEAKGGCKFCHVIEQSDPASSGKAASLVDWNIAASAIKSRWFPHAEFSHDSHRFLDCLACHRDVPESTQTSDILLPTIEVCRKCHSEASTTALRTTFQAVRSRCIDCHDYHDRSEERLDGSHSIEDRL
jgi:hypothetical protein